MKLYMKKTWGYDAPSGPLQFSESGAMRTALNTLQPEDRVVIVGTQGEETAPEDQGKLLGLMGVAPETVSSLDFYTLAEILPQYRDANGNYRWPFGLRVRRAWQFDEPKLKLSDVSTRPFGRLGVIGITELTEDETERILRLPRHEIGVRGVTDKPARIDGRRVGRSGPPPSTTRAGVMHLRRSSAYTYAMAIDGATEALFKIGWAFDVNLREQQFNRASLPALGGLQYKTLLSQYWDTARQAFQMEQTLLKQFTNLRQQQNSEVVGPLTMQELQRAWSGYVLRRRRGR
jgi:hypothetical protein